MRKDQGLYTRIIFNREHLFTVCRVGFMAQQIGSLWCEGWVLTERLQQMPVPYRVA